MKRNYDWTLDKYNRYISEKRGQGELDQYKPWLTTLDYPSLGRTTRIKGGKTGRLHHFFSDLQLKYFYHLEWSQRVIDIREHFPLLNYQDIVQDTYDLNMGLFTDKKSNVPYVLTTNFLITVGESNQSRLIARSITTTSNLERKTTLEKLEMERRYWTATNVEFGIVTNKDISNVKAKNIEWIHPVLTNDEFSELSCDQTEELSIELLERLSENTSAIRKVIHQFEEEYFLKSGTGILLFKQLIAKRKITINMDEPINFNLNSYNAR